MDPIALIGVIAGIAGVLSLLYVVFLGQRSLPELWQHHKEGQRDRKTEAECTIRHNLPHPECGQFVGRAAERATIERLLRPYPQSNFHLIALEGVGGVGKTALALEIAHHYLQSGSTLPKEERFDAIIWVSAKESLLTGAGVVHRATSLRTLEDLHFAIATVLERSEVIEGRPSEREILVRYALTKQRTLLIVDNLEEVQDESVITFLRELPAPTKAIVTTRYRIDVAYPVQLEGMSWADAATLVANECQIKGISLTAEQMGKLYECTGGMPLALVWSVAQISFGHTVESVLGRLMDAAQDVPQFCFTQAIAMVAGKPEFYLLVATSIFPENATPAALCSVAGLAEPATQVPTLLNNLERLSLVTRGDGRIRVLPLVKQMARAELSRDPCLEREYYERYVRFYVGLLHELLGDGFWQSLERWRNFRLIDAEISNITGAIDWSHHEQWWEELLSLTVPLVHYLHSRGLFEERLRQATLAIRAATALGRREIEAYMHIASIGWVYMRRGEWSTARQEIALGLTIARQISFTDAVVLAHAHLARIAISQRQFDEAEKLLDEVESFDTVAVIRCRVLFARALLEKERKNWQQAESYLRQAITVLSVSSDYLWPALHVELGMVLLAAGNLHDAEKVFKDALAFSQEMGRKTDIADSWFGLAQSAKRRHQIRRAYELAQVALDLFRRYRSEDEVAQVREFIRELDAQVRLCRALLSPFERLRSWLVKDRSLDLGDRR